MSDSNRRRRVVVTGLGTVNAIANDTDAFADALVEGKNGIAPIEGWDMNGMPTRIAGQVKNLDLARRIEARDLRRTARFTQLALIAGREALEMAGIAKDKAAGDVDRERVGVCNGTSIGSFNDIVETVLAGGPEASRVSPFFVPRSLGNMAAASLAMEFGFRGVNDTSMTACAAGTQAIGNALRAIQYGDADAMLAGGCEANVSRWGIACFQSMKALSTRSEDPERASRPFDRDRDGFVMGEGAGYIFIESEEHALGRGASILAEVAGFASTDDAYHQVMPDEHGTGAALAMERALRDAGLAPDELDYVNAHGTSTPLNDRAETSAIKRALGSHAMKVAISSTKSMIGHTLGAAGGIEAVATVLQMVRGFIHPTINYEHPDPDCDLDYVPNAARRVAIGSAMSNSFGFGGQNACVVFRRYGAA
ncbi:MAG TPA: beta-ketoacyl-ACP synthase II [Candidatus Dormibacteraeota bacterium]|jgi:3-oxoacyl-[acyl-carrier-protein] synthase II|nr:beta-ketoacyl-ACP synthase II [Candidatus Dormibacteraeota bacterium]